jgi:uncharacterized protein YjbK
VAQGVGPEFKHKYHKKGSVYFCMVCSHTKVTTRRNSSKVLRFVGYQKQDRKWEEEGQEYWVS